MLSLPTNKPFPLGRFDCVRRTAENLDMAEVFFALGIFLLPYDAFPVMPSTYRPISIVPFFIALLFTLSAEGKSGIKLFGRRQFLVLGFFALTMCIGFFRALMGNIEFDGLFDTVITLGIGLFVYFCLSSFLKWKSSSESFETTIGWLFHLLSIAYIVPLLVGCLEALSLVGILPASVNATLIHFFGGNQAGRLTLTSFEASWASIHLAIAAFSNLFLYRKGRAAFHLVCFCTATVLFLFTNSMQGILVLGSSLLVYIFWYGKKRKRLAIVLKWLIVVAVGAVLLMSALRIYFNLSGSEAYYATRIINFTNINNLIHSDGSSFIRIVFPIIGMQMFLSSPVFGVGAGAFAQHLPVYISEFYPWSVRFDEIAWYINGSMTPSAVCLYTRALGELGIVGSVPFSAFLYSSLKCVNSLLLNGGAFALEAVFLVFFLVCSQLQFASFAFLPFWLALSLLDSADYLDACKDASRI